MTQPHTVPISMSHFHISHPFLIYVYCVTECVRRNMDMLSAFSVFSTHFTQIRPPDSSSEQTETLNCCWRRSNYIVMSLIGVF